MKRLVCVLALVIGGCGSNATPASPSPPPAPVYPSLVGTWTGTVSIGVLASGVPIGTNLCQTTWLMPSQTNDVFSGTYTLSGGSLTPCVQSAAFSGTVTQSGAVSLTFGVGANPAGCVLTSQTAMTGLLSGGTITLQQTNHFTCGSTLADQVVTVDLTKR